MRGLIILLIGFILGAMVLYIYLSPTVETVATTPATPAVKSTPSVTVATPSPSTSAGQASVPISVPATQPLSSPPVQASDDLASRNLLIPVVGVKAEAISDTFNEMRGSTRRHEALDIMAAKGTPVVAVDDGTIKKLFTSQYGGLTIYQFDSAETVSYYYAHLDRYAEGIKEGLQVKKGDTLGYVGSTGNASPSAPHLHFAVFRLGTEKRWWEGEAINPYGLLTRP